MESLTLFGIGCIFGVIGLRGIYKTELPLLKLIVFISLCMAAFPQFIRSEITSRHNWTFAGFTFLYLVLAITGMSLLYYLWCERRRLKQQSKTTHDLSHLSYMGNSFDNSDIV